MLHYIRWFNDNCRIFSLVNPYGLIHALLISISSNKAPVVSHYFIGCLGSLILAFYKIGILTVGGVNSITELSM